MDANSQIIELHFLRNTLSHFTPEDVLTNAAPFSIACHMWYSAHALYLDSSTTLEQREEIMARIIEPLYALLELPGLSVARVSDERETFEQNMEGESVPRFSLNLVTVVEAYKEAHGKDVTRDEIVDRLGNLIKRMAKTQKDVTSDRLGDPDFWILDCVVPSRDASVPMTVTTYGAIQHNRFKDPEWKNYISGYDSKVGMYGVQHCYETVQEMLEDSIPQ